MLRPEGSSRTQKSISGHSGLRTSLWHIAYSHHNIAHQYKAGCSSDYNHTLNYVNQSFLHIIYYLLFNIYLTSSIENTNSFLRDG